MRLFFLILLALVVFSHPMLHAQKGLGIQHVVLIGVDGLSPSGIRKANTPVLDQIMQEGAYTLHARCVTPSSSSSNWASMIMGADVEQHGVHSNDYERDRCILPPVVQGKTDLFPTIFGEIDEQIPNARIGAIYHWGGFGRLFEKSAVDYDTSGANEMISTQLAVSFIEKNKPTFTFIHLDHVDHAGHVSGHGSAAYIASVAEADALIGQIIASIRRAGMTENTLVVISADHGGIGLGHGGLTMAEMEIPFLLWGKGIKKGFEIPTPVYQYDNAATIAFALGIEAPYAWIGRPVKCAFEGFDVPKRNYPIQTYLEKPVFLPQKFDNQADGGLFFEPTLFQLSNPNTPSTKSELRFTLDGSTPNALSTRYEMPVLLDKNTWVKSAVFQDGQIKSEVAEAQFRFVPKDKKPAVQYQCFGVDGLKSLPDFAPLKPISQGAAYEIGSDFVTLPRPEQVAVRLESNITIQTAGEYRFYTRSDDGSKLYLNGKTIVDNDGDHGIQEKSGKIRLEPGIYPIRVEWYNGGGGAFLETKVEGPGLPKQLLSLNMLTEK